MRGVSNASGLGCWSSDHGAARLGAWPGAAALGDRSLGLKSTLATAPEDEDDARASVRSGAGERRSARRARNMVCVDYSCSGVDDAGIELARSTEEGGEEAYGGRGFGDLGGGVVEPTTVEGDVNVILSSISLRWCRSLLQADSMHARGHPDGWIGACDYQNLRECDGRVVVLGAWQEYWGSPPLTSD